MRQCLVCNKEFEPVRSNHRKCSNLCCVRHYQERLKAKEKFAAILKQLKSPEALNMLNQELERMLEATPDAAI